MGFMGSDIQTGSIVGSTSARARPIWALCAVLALGWAVPSLAQQPARERVTLQQAIERALQSDPRVVQAQGEKRIAVAGERTAFGNYLPRLDASASSSLSGRNLDPAQTGLC